VSAQAQSGGSALPCRPGRVSSSSPAAPSRLTEPTRTGIAEVDEFVSRPRSPPTISSRGPHAQPFDGCANSGLALGC
jgi:hypothetical protein